MFQSVPGSHRSTGGGTGHPREVSGPNGPLEGSTPAHKGLARPYGSRPSGERKGGIQRPFPSLSPPFPSPANKERGRHLGRTPSRIRPTWGALLAAPSSPHLYICGRGRLAHPRQLLSRVRLPFHCLHPGHIYVVLRLSPTEITSPSPSPCRCAAENHLLLRPSCWIKKARTSSS